MNFPFPRRRLAGWAAAFLALALGDAVYSAAPSAEELAATIDRRIEERWPADDVKPAPPADDAEFLRRASLDLTGRIPLPRDVRDFLADVDPRKRAKRVDELLNSPRRAAHFARTWRTLLLPEADAQADARFFQPGFEAWLRDRWRERTGFDAIVRELLAVPISGDRRSAEVVFRDPSRVNPLAFYAVKSAQPENLAAAVSRTFLGVQLECAQCHDHPFAKWSQKQFWEQAAFFAGIEREGKGIFSPLTETPDRRELRRPESEETASAVFLDGAVPRWTVGESSRKQLAEWITAPANPFFARAAANRIWGQFFGVGLVDPVDDFNDDHPPSHPELLDELAAAFVASSYDADYLVRAICLSRAYGRTSALTDRSQSDPRRFARMPLRAMSGEQFFDSLALAVGRRAIVPRDVARERFVAQFAPTGKPSEPESSILQALALMNGRLVGEATSTEKRGTLAAIAGLPGATTEEKIEALHLAALSRPPTALEAERLKKYVDEAEPAGRGARLEDLFWALLNSAEFRLNH